MSTIKVNTITTRSGSTITLGESGKTIALACGASQTGFGRSGSVNWCTTAKTSPFTAENGKGYFVNTTSGVITVTLPASPSAGAIVAIKDYARTFGTNKVTLGRNSSKMDGACADTSLSTTGQSSTLSQGSVGLEFGTVGALSGVAATSGLGTLGLEFGPEEIITGLSATTNVGTLEIGSVELVDISGVSASTSVGSFTLEFAYELSGQSSTTNVGSLSPSDVMGLTGIEMTSSVGILGIKGYQNIDTGSNTSYNNLSTGSNSSYSDLSTGSNSSYSNVATGSNTSYTDAA